MGPRIIVVGGGRFFGGNSTKATSGINGALTRTQVDHGVADSVKQFYEDTMKSARDEARPDLIKVLTYQSAAAVEWLQDIFGLDLSLVSRLGGHSQPRTHRGQDAKFPGMAITYALMQRLEELAEQEPTRINIIMKARVTGLKCNKNRVTGVTYKKSEEETEEFLEGPVVLATGGYAADFEEDSLLKAHRPDVFGLATTNGSHATGDGQKMVMAIGGSGIDMNKVQVHPTGLVDPKDPQAKWKFLAAEALRGEGGILLNADGDRFCDELGHRDYVSGMMWKTKFPIRLVLNSKASGVLDFHTRHYSGRGLMKSMSGRELAVEIGCSFGHLQETFATYNETSQGGKDPWGKRFFHNMPFDLDDMFHVALMEPVLHFTMGGVEIDDKSRVLNQEKQPFDGLFACGEVAGGVHGANRLGGSSLLGCVVYGRVAGDSASNYLFQQALQGQNQHVQRLGKISLHLDPSVPGRVSVEWADSSNPGISHASRGKADGFADPNTTGSPNFPDAKTFSIPDKQFSMEDKY
ncbi:Fumarate reductase [Colletotrichum siamense]|nr:Fumarate reductase [Colletotrichum siamense]